MHLYEVNIDEKTSIKESDCVNYGQKLPDMVDSCVGKLGLSICYDLRFPELYRYLSQNGAEILLVPSAFFKLTG